MAAAIVLPVIVLLAGCNPWSRSGTPNTLVVDLTAVARAVGKDEQINASLAQTRQKLNADLETLAGKLNAQIDAARKQLGAKPSKDEQSAFTRVTETASTTLQQSRHTAQLQLSKAQDALFVAFRDQIKAIASHIARGRGAPLVQLVGSDVLWFDAKSDITAQVIARLRADNGKPAPAKSTATDADSATRHEIDKLNALVEEVKDK